MENDKLFKELKFGRNPIKFGGVFLILCKSNLIKNSIIGRIIGRMEEFFHLPGTLIPENLPKVKSVLHSEPEEVSSFTAEGQPGEPCSALKEEPRTPRGGYF